MANDNDTPGPDERPEPEQPTSIFEPPHQGQPEEPTDWYRPVEEPTATYPATPPPSVTIPANSPAPPVPPVTPVPVAAAPPPEEDGPTRNSELGWKVATAVAVLLAVGALIWGFMQKDNAEEIASSQGAALQDAREQIDADRVEEEELAQQLSRAQAAHDRVEAKLQTKKRDLKQEAAQLRDLQRDLQTAQRNADREEATLRDQARAAQAEAELAKKCAQVLATGMRVIYEAPTPQEVMDDVVKEMQLASESCAGVVSVG